LLIDFTERYRRFDVLCQSMNVLYKKMTSVNWDNHLRKDLCSRNWLCC